MVENNKGEKIGDIIKKSQQETSAIENTQTQPETPAIESTQTQPGVSLENTLTNLKEKEKGFFKIREDKNGQRYWNGIPFDISGDSSV